MTLQLAAEGMVRRNRGRGCGRGQNTSVLCMGLIRLGSVQGRHRGILARNPSMHADRVTPRVTKRLLCMGLILRPEMDSAGGNKLVE